MASFNAKLGGKGREMVRVKIKVSFCSYPTRYRNIQRNSQKIQKIQKYHYGSFSSHHRLKEDEKEGKEKLSFRSVPT